MLSLFKSSPQPPSLFEMRSSVLRLGTWVHSYNFLFQKCGMLSTLYSRIFKPGCSSENIACLSEASVLWT